MNETQLRDLTSVLDAIVPPSRDGRLPGAGELGLAAAVGETMDLQPDLRAAVTQGLTALEEVARARGVECFAALPAGDRSEVLSEVATREPGFLPGLIFHTYAGYYRHGRVLEALGLEARPPHPEGYPLEPGDLSGLDAVRRRGRLYREC